MNEIGIRELKRRLTSIVRSVREEQAEYTVTLHGKPVAVLRPYTPEEAARRHQQQLLTTLDSLDELAQAVGDQWNSSKNGVELVEAMREESACR